MLSHNKGTFIILSPFDGQESKSLQL